MAADAAQQLEERLLSFGWQILGVERRHVDVVIQAKAGSRPVRLTALSPFSTAGAVARAVADPTFFAMSVGAEGPPERWGVWQVGERHAPSWGAVQCVVSAQGMSVAAGFVSLPSTTTGAIDEFFSAAGGLLGRGGRRASVADASWPELDPTRALRDWPSRHNLLWRKLGQAALLVVGVGGAVGAVAAGAPQLAPYPFMVGAGGAVALSVDWSRGAVAQGKRVGDAMAKHLRSLPSFDEVPPPQILEVVQVPLIRAAAGLRYDDFGPMVRTGVRAKSSARGVGLRISVCSSLWPRDSLSICRLLPDRWIVVEARGPADVLDKFPARDRMERERDYLLWLLDERETAGEALWQVLDEFERGLRVGAGGPYR